jgi:hypothetical protein
MSPPRASGNLEKISRGASVFFSGRVLQSTDGHVTHRTTNGVNGEKRGEVHLRHHYQHRAAKNLQGNLIPVQWIAHDPLHISSRCGLRPMITFTVRRKHRKVKTRSHVGARASRTQVSRTVGKQLRHQQA